MNSTCDMLMLSSSDLLVICIIIFLIVFNICIARILSELSFFLVYARHMRTATLTVSHSNHLVNLYFIRLIFSVDAFIVHRCFFMLS